MDQQRSIAQQQVAHQQQQQQKSFLQQRDDRFKKAQCPHCDKVAANVAGHVDAVHNEAGRLYCCHLCTFMTMLKDDLTNHEEAVHPNHKKKKGCPECGKEVANLSKHIRFVHEKKKRSQCNNCGYRFAMRKDMMKHIGSSRCVAGKHMNATQQEDKTGNESGGMR